MRNPFSNSSTGLSPHTTFSITQRGAQKLQDNFGSDPKGKILMALETGGTCNVEELSQKDWQ